MIFIFFILILSWTSLQGQPPFNHRLENGQYQGLGRLVCELDDSIKYSELEERAHYSFKDDGLDTHIGGFTDAIELNDGTFMVIGRIILNANNSKTTVIARLDTDGCLEPDCGILNDNTSYLTSTKTVVNVDFDIYPNPVAAA